MKKVIIKIIFNDGSFSYLGDFDIDGTALCTQKDNARHFLDWNAPVAARNAKNSLKRVGAVRTYLEEAIPDGK